MHTEQHTHKDEDRFLTTNPAHTPVFGVKNQTLIFFSFKRNTTNPPLKTQRKTLSNNILSKKKKKNN
jgi:hypothetical protein